MKKTFLLIAAAGFAINTMAESVTLTHSEAGALASELNSCGVEVKSITELTVAGDAEMTAEDFAAIRSLMSATLQKLDISQAVFKNNTLPTGDKATAGILNNMAITECVLPETLTALSDGAFVKCAKLKSINIPEGVQVIPQYCFNKCTALSEISLPENLLRIMGFAFEGCTKLPFTELPSQLLSVSEKAFSGTNVAFKSLPETLTGNGIGQLCFANSKVAFSELPAGLTTLQNGVFLGTQVKFTTLPGNITKVGTRVFENVRTLTYFEIPDCAGLWEKIPDSFFYIANDDVERTFVCRSMTPPAAKVSIKDASGTFGKVAEFTNTTFKVPYSAMEVYSTTEPYSTMNLLPISVKVAAPIVEYPENVSPEHIRIAYVVGDSVHTNLEDEVCEGSGILVVSFSEDADANLYVSEIRNHAAVNALSDEIPEPTGTVLYSCDKPEDNLKKTVEIPVTVDASMGTHHIVIAHNSVSTSISEMSVAPGYHRTGDNIELPEPGAELYDIAGVCVRRASGNRMCLTELPAGVYVLKTGNVRVKILK